MEVTVEVKMPNTPLFRGEGPSIVEQESRAGLNAGTLMLQAAIIPYTPVGVTGALRQGVQTSLLGSGANLTGRVFNPLPSAPAVETGRKPGKQPPTGSLLLWVRRKLGVSDEKAARSVAFLVARRIGQRGTKGAFMFGKGFKMAESRVRARLNEIPARIVRRLGGS
jgi:hypothetical protein